MANQGEVSNTAEGHSSRIGEEIGPQEPKEAGTDQGSARWQERTHQTFSSDVVEALGIIESRWEPVSENKLLEGSTPDYIRGQKRRQLSIRHDLRGFKPTRLTFSVPHPDTDMNNDWFELLLVTLRSVVHSFCAAHFRAELAKPAGNANRSPWGTGLPPQFLHYAQEIARKDDCDGGWDSLLLDPRQRSYLVMGIVAKVLEEHVVSDLLFGASEYHQKALSHSDRIMIQEEGYFRKIKRSEEVRQMLEGETITPQFWDKVDHLTAGTASMLLPLLNLQRRLAIESKEKSKHRRTGICVIYQKLHDIIAIAGYASICMARSPSIFRFEFPEPGQRLDHNQDKVDGEHVFGRSLELALRADATAHARTKGPSRTPVPFNRIAKIKIVLWPAIYRYKPHWGLQGSQGKRVIDAYSNPSGATIIVLAKSQNVYYAGKNTDAADIDEGLPTLEEHVGSVHRRRRVAMFIPVANILAIAVLLFAVLLFPIRAKGMGRWLSFEQAVFGGLPTDGTGP